MYIILAILICSVYGFYLGKRKSVSLTKNNNLSDLHAKPIYHGYYIFFWCLIPALFIYISLNLSNNLLIRSIVLDLVPGIQEMSKFNIDFVYTQILDMASGSTDPFSTDEKLIPAVEKYISLNYLSKASLFVVILISLAASIFFCSKMSKKLRNCKKTVKVLPKIQIIRSMEQQ